MSSSAALGLSGSVQKMTTCENIDQWCGADPVPQGKIRIQPGARTSVRSRFQNLGEAAEHSNPIGVRGLLRTEVDRSPRSGFTSTARTTPLTNSQSSARHPLPDNCC